MCVPLLLLLLGAAGLALALGVGVVALGVALGVGVLVVALGVGVFLSGDPGGLAFVEGEGAGASCRSLLNSNFFFTAC